MLSYLSKYRVMKCFCCEMKYEFQLYISHIMKRTICSVCSSHLNLNLNGLLVIHQIDNTSPGGCARREISPWLTRDANLDTQSSDNSAVEIRETGRSFQSLIVCGKKLLLYTSLLAEGI